MKETNSWLLNIALDGGFPEKSVIKITGKDEILYLSALFFKKPSLYILADENPKILEEKQKNVGLTPEVGWYIDVYSEKVGLKDNLPNVTKLPSPSALTDISYEIGKKLEERITVMISSVPSFLLYTEREAFEKFLSVLAGRIREKNGILLVHTKPDVQCNIPADIEWNVKKENEHFTLTGDLLEVAIQFKLFPRFVFI